MRMIYRFELGPSPTTLELPEGSTVRHFAAQIRAPHRVCLWIEIDTDEQDKVERTFEICGTGQAVPVGIFLGTTQDVFGMVWHCFEVMQ